MTIKTRQLACLWMLPHSRPAHAFLTPHHAGLPRGVDTQADAALLPPPNQPPPEGDKEKAKQELGGLDAVVCVDVFGQYLSGIGGESLLTSAAHLPHLRHLSLSSCVFPACSVAPIAQVSSLVSSRSSCLQLPRCPRCTTLPSVRPLHSLSPARAYIHTPWRALTYTSAKNWVTVNDTPLSTTPLTVGVAVGVWEGTRGQALTHNKLLSLNLTSSGIDDKRVGVLCGGLARNTSLQTLVLAANQLGSHGPPSSVFRVWLSVESVGALRV